MVVTTLVMLVAHGWLPAWMVALLICRELTITALRTIAVSEGLVLAASTLGKFKTSFQSTALGFLLWHHETVFLGLFPVDVHACGIVLMYFALFFSLVSGWSYLNSFFRHAGSLNTA
jgi:CDP-diacylglycerol--glycerol-3-phosphate 3-phosphatidyltransferase